MELVKLYSCIEMHMFSRKITFHGDWEFCSLYIQLCTVHASVSVEGLVLCDQCVYFFFWPTDFTIPDIQTDQEAKPISVVGKDNPDVKPKMEQAVSVGRTVVTGAHIPTVGGSSGHIHVKTEVKPAGPEYRISTLQDGKAVATSTQQMAPPDGNTVPGLGQYTLAGLGKNLPALGQTQIPALATIHGLGPATSIPGLGPAMHAFRGLGAAQGIPGLHQPSMIPGLGPAVPGQPLPALTPQQAQAQLQSVAALSLLGAPFLQLAPLLGLGLSGQGQPGVMTSQAKTCGGLQGQGHAVVNPHSIPSLSTQGPGQLGIGGSQNIPVLGSSQGQGPQVVPVSQGAPGLGLQCHGQPVVVTSHGLQGYSHQVQNQSRVMTSKTLQGHCQPEVRTSTFVPHQITPALLEQQQILIQEKAKQLQELQQVSVVQFNCIGWGTISHWFNTLYVTVCRH